MTENNSPKDGTRRRNVLKGIGAAGFAGTLSGVAGADGPPDRDSPGLDPDTKQELQQLAEKYNSVGEVRSAFAATGAPLLDTLQQKGFIQNSSLEALPITELITPDEHEPGEEDGVMVVGVSTPQGPTARIQAVKKTERYTTVITVDADHEDARALVRDRRDESQAPRIVYPDGSTEVME